MKKFLLELLDILCQALCSDHWKYLTWNCFHQKAEVDLQIGQKNAQCCQHSENEEDFWTSSDMLHIQAM